MAGLKIRVPGGAQSRKGSTTQSEPPAQSAPRKRRKVAAPGNDEDYVKEEKERGHSAPSPPIRAHRSASQDQDQSQEVEHLFDNDAEVDMTGNADEDAMDAQRRPPRSRSASPAGSTYEPTASTSSHKRSARSSLPGESASRKRNKKKANVVYTDEEVDDYHEEKGGKRSREDRDDDFVVDSPPHKKQSKRGGAVGARGRGRGGRARVEAREKEIMVKDERKVVVQTTASKSSTVIVEGPTGTKRRLEAVVAETANEESVTVSQSSSSGALPAPSQPQDERPPPQKKKLPPIKKNKPPTSTGAPSATQATQRAIKPPAASSAPAETKPPESGSNLTPVFGVNLPKKPRAVTETTDIDLSSPDVYASLFKTAGSSTPRAGVNTKIKEEERRKELHKMRDEARAARLAELEKNTFDLLAGQEKVARFEAKLKERNSPALYPNHLASAIKYLVQSRAIPK